MSNRRAAIYGRVSTDWQTTDNQTVALREVAERRGWDVVEVYIDHGIGGAKGRDKRPGFDQMLKDANRRKFDVVMAWSIDRMGRSLRNLLETIEHLEATRVVIAHRLSTVINADQIFVIERGRVVQRGTYGELMNSQGLFVDLARRQLV